jgi:hypothetical protein
MLIGDSIAKFFCEEMSVDPPPLLASASIWSVIIVYFGMHGHVEPVIRFLITHLLWFFFLARPLSLLEGGNPWCRVFCVLGIERRVVGKQVFTRRSSSPETN